MRKLLLFILPFFCFSLSTYSQCGPGVPAFNVDLTGSPSGTWTSPSISRNGNCCGTTAPNKCIDFIITLDPGAVGVSFNIIAGAIPGGALFYQVGCGPPQALGAPICLTGPGPHLLTFCKPGNNPNVYQITSIPGAVGGTDVVVNQGCTDTLHATGFNPASVTWNSIFPGAPGAYNSLLSCTTGCTSPIVTGTSTAPPYVDYVICGTPLSMCSFATVCDTVRVTFNPTLFVSIVPINPTICFGATSTTITASGIGGTAPYTYLWNSINPSASITVGAGNYTVQLTDASGCPPVYGTVTVTSFSVTITANAGPDQTLCSQGTPHVTLNGSVTGASGGIWSGGAGTYSPNNTTLNAIYTPTAAEIASGSINLTLTTTGNGTCPGASDIVTINFLGFTGTANIVPVNVSCFGGTNGSATISMTGGTAPFTYSWNTVPAQTGSTATNLIAGTYTVTITNGIGCTSTSTVTITQPTPLAVSSVITNVSCSGGANGSITATPSGGTAAYTYLWAPGGLTTATISGQAAGTYTITVTDSHGCQITANYTITQPLPLAVSFTQTNVSCAGGVNGTAASTVTGGTIPYAYSWSPSGGTAATTSGLSAGTYTLTVTDAKGCIITGTVIITQPTPLSAATTSANETCSYLNNGTATVTASGATPAYTYLWMPGGMTTAAVSSLASGTYTVTVTDSKGCQITDFVTITQPPVLAVTLNNTSVSCFGGSDGTVSASPSGGTPGYTYSWAPGGATSATVTGVAIGTYTVTVTDINGCTTTGTTIVTQPAAALSNTSVITNVSCSGGSNGTISVTTSGGTPAYSYLWLPGGQTTASISGQSAGTYTVTVTDSKGCQLTSNYTITQPLPLAISFSHTNVSCFGGNNGTATATVSGGTPGYTYSWSPSGGTAAIASGLSAGTYTVTVTDSKGCVFSSSVTITEPAVLNAVTTHTNETCDYLNNGTATAVPSGGTPAYTYLWTPGGMTTSTISSLAAGTYTVTVTDSKGCVATATAIITQPLPLAISFNSQINVSCFGGSDGSVSSTPSGGTLNYSYSWLPGGATTNSVSGLSAGTYTLTVTDNNGCTVQNTVTITQPNLLTASSAVINASCNGGSNGSITAIPAGGTAPYTYLWLPGGQTTVSISGQTAGTYTVTVTDSKGCQFTANYTITQPLPIAISYTTVNVSCFSGSNGSANSIVTGGTAPYTYLWNPTGAITANITGLTAGTYTLTVTDNNGCVFSNSTVITEPTVVSVNASSTNETCDYLNNGTATATGIGGTPGYTYLWQPGALSSATITNLSSGTYTVTATDSKGCTATNTATITQPLPLAITFSGQINVSCFGGNDGAVAASPSGGTPNYSYSWAPGGAITNSVSGLTAGTYTLTITDFNGCTFQSSVTITQPFSPLSVSVSSLPTSCFGGSDGSASSTASGGTGPYTYSWMPGSINTQNIAGISAGTYTVTATDSKGCTSINTVIVTQPSQLILTTSTVNSNCGTPSGQAAVSVTGGFAPYTYSWSPSGGTGSSATGLLAGPYTVTVTDAHGCIEDQWANVNDNAGPSTTIFNIIDVSCFGGSNGSATVGVAGGIGPFTYLWAPTGGTGPIATGLTAGTYTVTVVDINGCESNATTSPDITQPPPIVINIITTPVSCFGGSSGSATASASGGTPGYTFQWLPGGTTGPSVTGLSATTYTVQVTDLNSCIQTAPFTITQPPAALSVSVSSTPVSCNGGSNGSVSSVATGGTGPYNYSWMPGSYTGQNISSLPIGTYTVTVVDSKGCTTTNSVTITQPTPIVLVTSSINSNCSLPNGQASVTASGGTPSYTYLWSPAGGTNSTATGLFFGPYTVVVTDLNGCTATGSITVNDNTGPTVNVTSTTNVSCNGGSNGTATATISGGAGPFTYSWSPAGGTAAVATGLPIGTYTVIVTDANGCASPPATSPVITQPSGIIINISSMNVSCFGGNNGSASATVSGGTPGYVYQWLPMATSGPTVSGLSIGTYTVQVTDTHGCIQSSPFSITQPTAPVSVSASSTPVSCFGGSNGTASSIASGGTSPYNYSWLPGTITGQNIAGLPIGTYTVTATDLNGCTATNSTTIIQPTAITLVTSSNNASCGAASGLAYVSASGGTPSYGYLWSPGGSTNDTAFALLPGTYSVTVTDNNGCNANTTIMVNNNPGPVATVISTTNVNCFGGSDGTATVGIAGGASPFTYAWSPLGGTAATASGLPIGTYTVTVTDLNGCVSADTTIPITQPTPVIINISTTNVSCFGGNNGSASAIASGGTPGYTYLWLPGGTGGGTANTLSAGTYTVQVTDSHACIQQNPFTITQPTLVNAVITSSTNVSCFGGNNGTATVTASGGTPFYSYNWLPSGGSAATGTGLAAGTYTVTVIDFNGCTATATVTITQPVIALSATASGTATSCFGGSNGTATATPSGGTPLYTYVWSPSGGTSSTASGLNAGNYTVLITDNNGCQTNSAVTITQPTAITGTLAVTDPSCGLSNGAIVSMISGGTGPYTYSWTPGAVITPNITGIGPGAYSLVVTDNAGCTANFNANLINIAGPTVSISSFTNVSCNGGNDGTATANITSGTSPYSMNWSPYGGTSLTGTGFIAGSYTINVTDALGCTASATAIINEPSPVALTVSSTTNVSCNGGSNGSITVAGSGGTPTYTYSWSPVVSASSTVTGLTAGIYTATVTDQHSCTTSISVNVTQPAILSASFGAIVTPSCYNSSNGSITVAVTGGTIPYNYLWSDGQTGSTASGLVAGPYNVSITDANGCTTTLSMILTQPTEIITTAGINDTICQGASGTVTATASGGAGAYYYTWQPSGIINGGIYNVTPLSSTTYTVTAYDGGGCAGTPDTVSAIVYNLTAANINAIALSPICPGQSTVVYATASGSTGPLTYSWNNGLGTGPGGFLVTPSSPITYIVTVTNSCGASVVDSVSITFNPPPTILFTSDTNSICAPGTIQFTDNSVTGNILDPITGWFWTFGDGGTSTLQDPTHVYNSPGTYSVILTVTTLGGCTNSNASVPYIIYVHPYPIAAFSQNLTSLDLPFDMLILNNMSTGATNYLWTFGDGGNSTAVNPQYLYTSVGIYPIMLIATNAYGCSDTAYSSVTTNADVIFPNVFTPDTGGPTGGAYDISSLTNDVFFPYTSGVTEFKFEIFNRWGELIFVSTDINKGWDGYYKGQLCQQDVYVWKAYIKLNNGKIFNKTGDVTLLR